MACFAIALLSVPFWTQLAGIGSVLVSSCFVLQKVHPVLELVHKNEKNWYLQTKTRRYTGVLSDMSWVSPYAAVLIFRVTGQKQMQPVILMGDSVDKNILRQLGLYLRRG